MQNFSNDATGYAPLKECQCQGSAPQPPQPIIGGSYPQSLGHERGKYLLVFDSIECRRGGMHAIRTDIQNERERFHRRWVPDVTAPYSVCSSTAAPLPGEMTRVIPTACSCEA